MKRSTFNLVYWPLFVVLFIAYAISTTIQYEEIMLLWAIFQLQIVVGLVLVLWFRLKNTTIHPALSLLFVLPFGGLVMGLITAFAKDKETQNG